MDKGMQKIVREGWEDKRGGGESAEGLLKSAVFALRRDIDKKRHQFENEDGSVREADPKIGTGSFNSLEEVTKWHHDLVNQFQAQKTLLSDALVHVEHEVLTNKENIPDVQYLNQVGGPYNYVANLVLERVADVATSVKEMHSTLQNFMPLFFHVSGWERFTDRVERRLASSKSVAEKAPPKGGLMGWLRRREQD